MKLKMFSYDAVQEIDKEPVFVIHVADLDQLADTFLQTIKEHQAKITQVANILRKADDEYAEAGGIVNLGCGSIFVLTNDDGKIIAQHSLRHYADGLIDDRSSVEKLLNNLFDVIGHTVAS